MNVPIISCVLIPIGRTFKVLHCKCDSIESVIYTKDFAIKLNLGEMENTLIQKHIHNLRLEKIGIFEVKEEERLIIRLKNGRKRFSLTLSMRLIGKKGRKKERNIHICS